MSATADDDPTDEASDFAALVERFRSLSNEELREVVRSARLQQERCRREQELILRVLNEREAARRSASLSHPHDSMTA